MAAVAWLLTPPTVTVTVTVPVPGGATTAISVGVTNTTRAGLLPKLTLTRHDRLPGGQARPVPVRCEIGQSLITGVTTNWRRYRSRKVTGPRGPGTLSMLIPVSGTDRSLNPSSRRVVAFQNAPVPA